MSWARFIRSAAVLALAVPLLGMDGCAQSRHPLSTPEEGFVDPYLLGNWYSSYVSENGEFRPERLHLEITAIDGNMRVRWYDEEQYCDLTGYSTRVKDKKYANLRLLDCSYWTVSEKQAGDFDACPHHLIQYRTFMPNGLARSIDSATDDVDVSAQTLLDAAEAQRGQTLFYAFLWGSLLERAIEEGELAGAADCEGCGSAGPCIHADTRSLRAFLLDHDAELYPNTLKSWVAVVRGDD